MAKFIKIESSSPTICIIFDLDHLAYFYIKDVELELGFKNISQSIMFNDTTQALEAFNKIKGSLDL